MKFFKKLNKKEEKTINNSRNAAKERLHLVLMQDRANVSADFLELMKQEIIEVIKKYIDVDEGAIDVRLTNKENEDGTNGAPALYANIPIVNIKNEARKVDAKETKQEKQEEKKEEAKETKQADEVEKEERAEEENKVEIKVEEAKSKNKKEEELEEIENKIEEAEAKESTEEELKSEK